MTKRLEGRRAVVTGGSRGIGAGIVRRLAEEGADVALLYGSNREAAAATAAAVRAAGRAAHVFQADAADAQATGAAIDAAAEALGGIDILVLNAGVALVGTLADQSVDDYRKTIGVNVDGVFAGAKAALPHLSDGGSILITGSVSGHWNPAAGFASYGASKAAVAALGRGWARDLGARGIRVNVIQPGPIDTDMNPADGDLARQFMSMIALGRYGRVEEVGALAAFLASDEASFITGAAIDIDGGVSI